MRTAIYVRLSEVRPGEEAVSLATQETDCRALLERKGWSIEQIYRDAGRSAWQDNRDRPAFTELLQALDAGELDAIVAWKQDRLGRRVAEVADLLDRCRRHDVALVTVNDGLDTTTPAGRMASQVIAAAAEMESANTSVRVARSIQARAERGDAHGGPRPYGYRRENGTLVVVPEEAGVIRECADRVLQGETVGSILRDLQARGVTTSTGGPWRRRSLLNTLRSARIAGLREYHGVESKGTWQAIVTTETLQELRTMLEPSPVKQPQPRSFFLSGGIATCGKCGYRLKGRTWDDGPRKGRRQYHCPPSSEQGGCGGTAINADALEEFIAGIVIARLCSSEFRKRLEAAGRDPHVDDLYKRLRKLDAAADDLAAAFGAGDMNRRAYVVANGRNDAERQAVEKELRGRVAARPAVLDNAPSRESALLQWWEDADVHQRHDLTAAVIDEVKVGPAIRGRKTFDPDRLEVVFR